MRVCFEIFYAWRAREKKKKKEAFLTRFVTLGRPSSTVFFMQKACKKRASRGLKKCEHKKVYVVRDLNEKSNALAQKKRKETARAALRREREKFFCVFALPVALFFSAIFSSLARSGVPWNSHPRKDREQRQHGDVHEDDVLLLRLKRLPRVFVVFVVFFETVATNWTGRREKKELFETFNIITIDGGKSG